ncbi:NmrA family protein [Richelia sinica FACHB-800]|uniref:NmrA family protein n=1 Tax=Richelia sinica FACHB-800 TaxID=1357546 RepID=A0A975Y592_9NOST|nr:SDR family oxidoreductase [Richelia sinica]MBD2665908.1 SDR family oxidoreductase [Richelia sinica FACHB-800]QXE23983.1 NmrA family protein [Richelia sinica FACHB-800]
MFLVTGATGGIGRRVVRLLRQQKKPVRVFVRLTSHYSELEHRGADIFIGDLRREDDIQKACQGAKYIISAHGSNGDALSLDYRANIELIDQAKEQGVEHFIFISVLGADRGYEDGPVFKAKRAVEQYLQSSGLNYTILRPAGLASNLLPLAELFRESGLYLLIGDPKHRTSIVSTDDLARMIVDSLIIPDARNQILPVGGPEILLGEHIPQIFSRIFNKEPIVINAPLLAVDGLRGVLGLFSSQIPTALGNYRTLLANEFFCTPEETTNLERIFNFQLEPLEKFLRRYLAI